MLLFMAFSKNLTFFLACYYSYQSIGNKFEFNFIEKLAPLWGENELVISILKDVEKCIFATAIYSLQFCSLTSNHNRAAVVPFWEICKTSSKPPSLNQVRP